MEAVQFIFVNLLSKNGRGIYNVEIKFLIHTPQFTLGITKIMLSLDC